MSTRARAVRDVGAFADVARLQRRRDAEQTVGRIGLVAVLGQPDARAREVPRRRATTSLLIVAIVIVVQLRSRR